MLGERRHRLNRQKRIALRWVRTKQNVLPPSRAISTVRPTARKSCRLDGDQHKVCERDDGPDRVCDRRRRVDDGIDEPGLPSTFNLSPSPASVAGASAGLSVLRAPSTRSKWPVPPDTKLANTGIR